jgi:rubredoxin
MTTATTATEFKTWMCLICGYIYDEATGVPEEGIAAGTRWEDVPINWTCPECGARKEDFEMVEI